MKAIASALVLIAWTILIGQHDKPFDSYPADVQAVACSGWFAFFIMTLILLLTEKP